MSDLIGDTPSDLIDNSQRDLHSSNLVGFRYWFGHLALRLAEKLLNQHFGPCTLVIDFDTVDENSRLNGEFERGLKTDNGGASRLITGHVQANRRPAARFIWH
jgi:hypothetical protein